MLRSDVDPSVARKPLARITFNTRHWKPARERSGLEFNVRMHDLRHAHASWLLAGGADLKTAIELPEAQDEALAAFERVRSR
ncbi:tyrosine-type recombinase/integrase [Actinotalea ferrariae]|uniref:tyrosine-type recombinase/integrase n=1 Tax=Actinotalea ferrariae TaxID=1386098 RepID=UPI001C8CC83A|nr:tyrosine-type recombinase/integrase [Actinotalea ferrariae]MBX9243845.1 tyrosine-type recombinase/integrase [Actinotalea ferrariae]